LDALTGFAAGGLAAFGALMIALPGAFALTAGLALAADFALAAVDLGLAVLAATDLDFDEALALARVSVR
jgi:hypothetical protein